MPSVLSHQIGPLGSVAQTNQVNTATACTMTLAGQANFFTCLDYLRVELFASATNSAGTTPLTITVSNMAAAGTGMIFLSTVTMGQGQTQIVEWKPRIPSRSATVGANVVVVAPANSNLVYNMLASYFYSPY